ncbi:uncharacterized protein LOC130648685 [Hydractinia symbiolongicarpus]|uniref:uncharacterized protein LOC130648685 n=1 Tax=Hydractinia symbiolongicarpus TaxID=13093 RepID=UPI00254C1C55|nr:uncharacterized protein LOC130648685 [Hydractinia symbiolongicarpus]XP_057310736.1 uncharacterized protein LOC130648685 [Hydractinia symbiolongicarpus]
MAKKEAQKRLKLIIIVVVFGMQQKMRKRKQTLLTKQVLNWLRVVTELRMFHVRMFQGELFGYPLYLMKTFMAEKNVKFCFADVMCKLWKFVKQHEPSLRSLLRPALSVMHAKGHALNCQILWSGEWLEGTGKSTGEETEQVFGYLSRCRNTTKHQTPENREETITEMAMFWNKRKILNIIKELSRRFLKCKHDIVKADDALTKVKQDTGLHEMEKEVDKWINDMKVSASGNVLLYYYRFLEFGLEEKQHELQRLLNIPACIESILESYSLLKNDIWKPIYQREIDKAFMVKVSWGMQIKKIADTSKRRHVVRAKFGVADKALKELIVDYCRVYSIENVEEVFRCCETGEFPWIGISSRGEPSATDRQLCAELTQKKRRLVEERELLSTDMKSCMKYYCLKVETLNSRIKDFEKQISQSGSMNDKEDPHDLENSQALFGELILMRKGLLFYQNCLEKAVSVFQKCINLGNVEILQNSETEGDGDEYDSEDDNARDNDFDMLDKESTSDVEEVYFPNNEVNSEFVLAVGIELAQGYKKDPLVVKEDSHTKTCMCPLSLCQSLLNNANGSNACVVISLIMGYMLTKNPTVFSNLQVNHDSSCFLSIFCGAIEVGNYLYTKNSMEGFLTVVEGLDILPEYFNLTIQEEFNCNMDENDNSFLKYLREIQVTDTNNFVITVARGKSMCWTITKDGIFCIDSHRNGCYGGKVVRLKYIDDQINTVILDIISDPFFYYCSIEVS